MAANSRAIRLLKAMDNLVTKKCFDSGVVLNKVSNHLIIINSFIILNVDTSVMKVHLAAF